MAYTTPGQGVQANGHSNIANQRINQLHRWINLAFLLLALGLATLALSYWHFALEPGLRQDAQDRADLMAQAQAERLAERLQAAERQQRPDRLTNALDEILSFTNRNHDTPFFVRVELELAPNTALLGGATPSDDRTSTARLQAGSADCHNCFRTEIPLLDPRDFHLIGIGHFWINDRLFQQLRQNVRTHLLSQAVLGGILLLLAWIAVLNLTRQIQRQSARRQQAERALQHNQARYQRLLDNLSGYFVYARSIDGRINFVSDSVQQVLGYTPAAFRQQFHDRPLDLFNQLDLAQASDPVASNRVRLALRDQDGNLHHLECSETPSPDASAAEAIEGIEGIARDVTAQQALEDSLREAKEQAERANRAKSAFLANISHEIRTPMAGIVGLTQLLLKQETEPRLTQHLQQILASGHYLLTILNDILDISKMEAGKVALEQKPFVLEQVFTQLVSLTAIRAEEKALEFVLAVGPGIPKQLCGDATRLGQILLNLTNNAIKFTKRGHVLVCVERLRATDQSIMLRFAVEDTGIGINPQDRRRLFEPFTQLDDPRRPHHIGSGAGTGLGLAISRHLVEQMGGRLAVDSTPEHGSRFSFTAELSLPAATAPEATPDFTPEAPPAVTSGAARQARRQLSILLLVAHPLTQCILADLLSEAGYRVTLTDTAAQARHQLDAASQRGQAYQVLLLDAACGFDSLDSMDNLAASAPAVVLITGYGARAHPQPSTRIDAHLLKPVHRTALLEAITQALGRTEHVVTTASSPAQTKAAASFPPSTRVLLAEDHALNRDIATQFLRAQGLEVEAVADGYAVLERLEQPHTFDAVLMDIQMPGLNGIETTQRLRADPRWAELPVIAITAYAMIGDAEHFRAAGMNDCLSKPIDEAQLQAVLRRWLPHSSNSEDSASLSAFPDASSNAITHFARTHQPQLAKIRAALAQGYAADAIAIAHRVRTAAQDIEALSIAKAAHALQQAIARNQPYEEPLQRLEAALQVS